MNWIIRLGLWWENRKKNRPPTRKEFNDLSAALAKSIRETALMKLTLDRVELFVGLKREPKPIEVPGTARIS